MADEVVDTPFGKFLIDPRDIIGSTLKAGTLWDGPGFLQPIAWEYGQLGRPRTTIIDVGANIGSFSVWLAYHKAWRVVAVEPVAKTMAYLKANLDLNKGTCADRVVTLPLAAYNKATTLWYGQLDPGNLGGTALVPAGGMDTTAPLGCVAGPLDDYRHLYGDRVSLIKIDAQGCDGAAIVGLVKTIKRDRPAIVFEWEADLAAAHGYTLKQTRDTLSSWGYSVQPWPSHANNYLAVWQTRRLRPGERPHA